MNTVIFKIFGLAWFLIFDIKLIPFYSLTRLYPLRTDADLLSCNFSQIFKKRLQLLFYEVYFWKITEKTVVSTVTFIVTIFAIIYETNL